MNISSLSGSSFKLKILGYQYPYIADDYYDANWLLIQVDVTHPKGSWSANDPCLLTFEVERLAKWLEEVHDNINKKSYCSFTEPCLEFRVEANDKGERVLRIYFELEIRPLWTASNNLGMEDFWVDFPLAEIDLPAAARDLRSQLHKYPQRVFGITS